MKKAIVAVLIMSSALLSGCAGTSAVVKSQYRLTQGEKLNLQFNPTKDASAAEGMSILKGRLTSQLGNSMLLAAVGDAGSRTLEVSVLNYNMRAGAARALLGVLAGSDNVKSTITIKDAATGKVLSEYQVESKNPTAWGTARGLLEDHADQIVETLKGSKT